MKNAVGVKSVMWELVPKTEVLEQPYCIILQKIILF
jgi:hypothetical protein